MLLCCACCHLLFEIIYQGDNEHLLYKDQEHRYDDGGVCSAADAYRALFGIISVEASGQADSKSIDSRFHYEDEQVQECNLDKGLLEERNKARLFVPVYIDKCAQ